MCVSVSICPLLAYINGQYLEYHKLSPAIRKCVSNAHCVVTRSGQFELIMAHWMTIIAKTKPVTRVYTHIKRSITLN